MALFEGTSKAENVEPKPVLGGQLLNEKEAVSAVSPDPAKAARKKAKRDARDVILAYIADEKNKVPANVVAAAKKFAPAYFGISNFGGFAAKEYPACVEKLVKLLGHKNPTEIKASEHFDELKAFQTLKAGRKEMRELCVSLIKHPSKLGAIYVSFDATAGVYTVASIGAEPKGWTGYRPAPAEA